jgi:hypothetical protein
LFTTDRILRVCRLHDNRKNVDVIFNAWEWRELNCARKTMPNVTVVGNLDGKAKEAVSRICGILVPVKQATRE